MNEKHYPLSKKEADLIVIFFADINPDNFTKEGQTEFQKLYKTLIEFIEKLEGPGECKMEENHGFVIDEYYVIRFYDHFTTDTEEQMCIGETMGKYIGGDEIYVRFQSFTADVDREDSANEIHNIISSCICEVIELKEQRENTEIK